MAYTKEQIEKYNKIRASQGQAAADKYRASVDKGGASTSGGIQYTPEERSVYNALRKNQGNAAAEKYRAEITKKYGGTYVPRLDKDGKELSELGNTSALIAEAIGLIPRADRIDTSVPADYQNLINSTQAMTDPTSAGFVGRRSDQMADQLRLMQEAQSRSAETDKALKTLEGGLAGLNAQENRAIRESAQRQKQLALATAMSQINASAAQSGARGLSRSAALGAANRDYMKQRAESENDLLVKNIDIQDSRRRAYADQVGLAEERERLRRSGYADALGAAERDEFGRTRDITDLYGRILDTRNKFVREGQQFNALQGNVENAAKTAGITGLMSLQTSRKYNKESLDLARKQLEQSMKMASSAGGGGMDVGALEKLMAGFQADQEKIIKQQYGG